MDIFDPWDIAECAAKERRLFLLGRQNTKRLLYDQQFSQDFGLRLRSAKFKVCHSTVSTVRRIVGQLNARQERAVSREEKSAFGSGLR
jgi:hypothetical protein